ncbi:MAG: leucine-rich repeat protein [Eubacterium sp.]
MKKVLSTLLAFVMLATTILAVPFSAQAEVKYPEASGTLKSGQTYTYDASTETLTISGVGEITQYDYSGEGVSPFANCTIKHIVIGEGITKMYNYIFNEVLGIETVSLPASLTLIYYRCFEECEFIGSGFTVADDNNYFSADNGSLYNKDKTRLIKFVSNGLTEFTVPDSVTTIAYSAFNRYDALDKLVLNGTNLSLDDYAIYGAKIKHLEINEGVKNLGSINSIDSAVWEDETITLPASLETIGPQSIFDDATPIKNFVVAEGNTVFSTIDGVLYKDGTTLFSYPAGRTDTSFTVPDGTTKIESCAFSSCNNLESVDIPASVKTFSSRSFKFCSNVTNINIRALDAEFLDSDCFFYMNSSVVYKVYENSATYKNIISIGIAESKIAFFPLCADHSYELTKTVEPSCFAKGYDVYTCSVCGTTEIRNETNTVDHEVVTTYNEDKTVEHHKCKNFAFIIEETENLPQSEHDYQSDTDEYFELSYPGATTISITFDEQFKTETNYDYLKAYDKDGNEIAKYTGTDPAGQTYTLNGDYIKLHFHSDGSGQYYGFKITKVVAEKVGCDYAEADTPHTHSYSEYVYNDDSTCTENGTETATCACGQTNDREKENTALGHDWEAATCLVPKTCNRCGATEGGLGEHSYAIVSQCPATCNADGYINYECTVCSGTKQEAITARPDHQLSDRYDSETNSVITTCANKDGFVVEYTEDLPESKHYYDNGISEEYVLYYPGAESIDIYFNNSTLVEKDYDFIYIYKDSVSGEQIGKYTSTALSGKTITVNSSTAVIKLTSDHNTTKWGFKVDKVVATYPGCGYETSAVHTTHNVTTYTSDNNATCTEDGTKTGTCTICNKPVTVADEGSKLGHDLVETADAVNATCFSVGWTAGYKCSRCDYEVRQEEVAKLPHTYNSGVVTKKATCTEAGVKTYTCTVCDATKTESIPKLAHTYKAYTTRATTSSSGKIVTKCSVCGAVKSTQTIARISSVKLSGTSYTYNGKVKTPSVTVKNTAGKTLVKNTDYTVSYASGRKNVGKYAVKVTFKGKYSGTKTLYFTIKPKATSISSISAKSKGFTVKWYRRSTQTTGYQVQYSTSSKFTGPKTVTVSKYSTTSKTVSKLKAKKRYYVRVRTYKIVNGTRYYSSWSKYKTVTTKS